MEDPTIEPLNLDVDLSAVPTGLPVLRKGLYPVTIISAGVKPNKEQTGRNLVVQYGTINAETTTEGKQLKPGFKLTAQYHLQNKPEANDQEQWKQNLAMLWEAATGSKPAGNIDSNDLIGRLVTISVSVGEYNGQPSNKVERVQKPA